MKEEIDFLSEINSKYTDLEDDLEQKLQKLLIEEQKFDAQEAKQEKQMEPPKQCGSLAEAKKRNSEIIKSLEVAKARLRSRATYTPIESILQKGIKAYEKEMSLVPIIKKVYGPTYV